MSTAAQPEMTGFETEQVVAGVTSSRFFAGGRRGELLDQVVHLTRFGTLLVNVSGEAGSGKSHLLHAVKSSLPGTAIEVNASLLMSASELLNQMLHQLMASRFHHDLPDLPQTKDEGSLLSIISSYFLRLADSGSSIVILIDDAHELSEEALQILFRLIQDKKHVEVVRCVLFSEPYLEKLLSKSSVKESGGEQVFTLKMPVMDRTSTQEYLSFLESAKPETERIMYSEKDVSTIHELSEGILGQVNAAIRSLLERESPTKKVESSSGLSKVNSFVLILVVLSIAGVLFLYLSEKQEPVIGEVVENTRSMGIKPEIIELQSKETTGAELENEQAVERPVSSSLLDQLREKQEQLLKERNEEIGKPVEEVVSSSAVTSSEIESVVPKIVEKAVVPSKEQSLPVQEKDKQESAGLSTGSANTSKQVNDSEKWIIAQPGNHYTIQILGAHSEKNVTRYVDNFNGDHSELVVYEGVLRDQPWFVLISGSYPNRAAAKEAGTKMGLKDVWIRSFSSVQQDLKR